MMIRRLCYLALVLTGGFLVMLYNFRGLRFLLCCLFIVPMVSFLLTLPGKFLCKVRLEAAQNEAVRGEAADFTVRAESRSLFPIAKLRLDLRWEMPDGGKVKEKRWLCGLERNREERFSLELSADHCGMAALSVRKAAVCDYLGLFALSAAKNERVEVCIMPLITPVSAQVKEICSPDSMYMGTEREGDLLLRDFLPGDSIHRIYWKLAAKDRELQVRDFERSSTVTLFLNFSEEDTRQAEMWDKYLDKVCSLLYFLAEEGRQALQISPEVVWRRGEMYLKSNIPDGEAASAWIAALLKGKLDGAFLTEEEILSLGNSFWLEEDGRLYFGGRPVTE